MSNALLMTSLAGIAGGFGRSPAKEPTGVAKERVHLKNLPSWERDAAKAEYKALVDRIKADRAAAIAEWFNRYPAAMPIEHKKIDKVVAKFLVGDYADAAASGVSTDGIELKVQGATVAARKNASDRFITVCPGLFGEGKAARYTANSTLRHVGAGIRVTDIRRGEGDEGFAFFAPNRSPTQGRIVLPEACVRVEVTKKMREEALKTAYGTETARYAARESYDTEPAPRAPSNPKHARHYGRTAKSTKKSRAALKKRLQAKRKK